MSSPRDLRLQVILQAVDKAGSVLRGISGQSSQAAKALKETRDRLKELNTQQEAVSKLRKLQEEFKGTVTQAKAVRARIDELRNAQAADAATAKAHAKEISAAEKVLRGLNKATEAQTAKLGPMRERLQNLGIRNVAADEARLRTEIEATSAAVTKQKAQLDQLSAAQKRLNVARKVHDRTTASAGAMAVKGAAATGGGFAVLRGLHGPVDESKAYGTEIARIGALGLGAETTADAEKFAAAMKTVGTSRRDNLTLVRDAMSVFADLHHAEMVAPTLAKMKMANAAVFGAEHGHENEKKFMDMLKVIELRGGLASEAAFKDQADKIQRVIAATGGRVQGEEWLNVIKTGGVAAKGLSDEALYYQMEPLVQEMGGHRVGTALMSAYQNIYQGHTTKRAAQLMDKLGLIGDRSKVDHDKSGQVAHLSVGALKGSDLFRTNQFEWMEKVLLPALAKKGITSPQHIIDTMGGLFSNRTASGLFAQMYQQREQIHKNARLNAGADGIQQLYERAQTTGGAAELELAARKADAYRELGTTIMPAYTRALELAAGALSRVTSWMAENPTAARVLAYGVGGLAVAFVALGSGLLALSPALLTWAGMRLAFTTLGVQGPSAIAVLRGVGSAVLWLGRALFTTPLGLAITALAGAAYVIYRNWNPIVAWLERLPDRMAALGLQIALGISRGITNGMTWVRDTISTAADNVVTWFKDKLGIRSPSRVFMLAGSEISAGAAVGIEDRMHLVRRAALGMATAAASALPLTAAAIDGGPRIDRRPPLASAAAPAAPVMMGGPVFQPGSIVVQASPGMNEEQLARLVGRELDRRLREDAARRRSSLHDID